MTDEKILKDEVLSDEELDGVAGGTRIETSKVLSDEELDGLAGGTRIETSKDGDKLYKRRHLSADNAPRDKHGLRGQQGQRWYN